MGDRYPAQIRIGGQVSRTAKSKTNPDETVLEALLGMIAFADVSDEFGGRPAEPDNEATLLEFVEADTGQLLFRDETAINGEIQELEEFCRTEGLSYNRNCGCYGGFLGEDVTWTPNTDLVMTLETDDGHEQVDGSEVRRALELLVKADATEAHDLDEHQKDSYRDQAKHILGGLCPDIPTVPKFEVIP